MPCFADDRMPRPKESRTRQRSCLAWPRASAPTRGRNPVSRLQRSSPPVPMGDCSVPTFGHLSAPRRRGASPLPPFWEIRSPRQRLRPRTRKFGVQGQSPCGDEVVTTGEASDRCGLPPLLAFVAFEFARPGLAPRHGASSRPCQARPLVPARFYLFETPMRSKTECGRLAANQSRSSGSTQYSSLGLISTSGMGSNFDSSNGGISGSGAPNSFSRLFAFSSPQ